MWLVGVDIEYYPSIETYNDGAQAKIRYEELKEYYSDTDNVEIYLAEVKESASK